MPEKRPWGLEAGLPLLGAPPWGTAVGVNLRRNGETGGVGLGRCDLDAPTASVDFV